MKSELDMVAARIRLLYVAAKRIHEQRMLGFTAETGQLASPRCEGGYDQEQAKEYRAIWIQVAEKFLAHQVDPGIAVKAVFDRWRDTKPPLPSYLLGDFVIQLYRERMATLPVELERHLEIQNQTLKSRALMLVTMYGMDQELAAHQALMDDAVDLTPLYRYSLGVHTRLADVQHQFHDQALYQYMFSTRLYDAAWGRLVPEELRTEVARILK